MRRRLLHGLVSILAVISSLYLALMVASGPAVARNEMASLSFTASAFAPAPGAIISDFYSASANPNGTLRFASQDGNATFVDSAASFYLNYGTTSSADVSPYNSSFEVDSNSDGIPDGWSVNKSYIYKSADYASQGSYSLEFYSTSPDSDHRAAYSPLIPINGTDKTYSINVDSFYSSFTSGIAYAVVAIVYSNTPDGSGGSTVSDSLTRIGLNIGSWSTNNLIWNAPYGAKSFQVMLYVDKGDVSTVYFDNLKVTEITRLYETNGSSITSNISTSGDNITVLSTDDSNPEVTVTNRYDLNTHSPNVSYTATLTYKQNVTVSDERFDFTVPTQTASVMNRGLQMTTFNTAREYYSDLYTPKVVKFGNGVSWSGTDTMQSMRLRASGSNSQLSFYSDYCLNHPYFYYVKNGNNAMVDISAQKRWAGDSYTASVIFAVNPASTPLFLVKARQPFGYDATLVMTNHADDEMLGPVNAAAYGTEDTSSPAYGTKGIVGRNLGWTKTVFLSGQSLPYMDLSNPTFKALTDKMFHDGVEIIAHSITKGTDNRDVVDAGMQQLSTQYGSRNWIDHGASGVASNWEALGSQGTIKGDPNYTLDLFAKYGYDYAWSYIDFRLGSYSLNLLANSSTNKKTPFFYYNNNVDDNPGHDKKIYLWSTIFTDNAPDLYYTTGNIDDLIAQRGVHIGHEYDGHSLAQNHTWYTNSATGKIEIYPTFDNELAYMAAKRDAILLWVPTMTQFGDFLQLLPNIAVVNNQNGTYNVINNNAVSINGLTLLSETPLTSVTMNGTPLTSFGGTYGANELVLPSLNPGQTAVLSINNSFTPPVVTTDAATNITSTTATLNGNLTSKGSTTGTVNVSFEYGLTASYGSTIAGIPSSLSAPGAFSANLSGLTANTTYHFRARGEGGSTGVAYGSDQTFVTASGGGTAVMYENYHATQNATGMGYYCAQTFTPQITHTITSFKVHLINIPGLTGTLTGSIRATDANGAPTGANLAVSSPVSESTIPGGWSWTTVQFDLGSGCQVQAGTRYALQLYSSVNGDEMYNQVDVPGQYANGSYYTSSNGTYWNPYPTYDIYFEEWGI